MAFTKSKINFSFFFILNLLINFSKSLQNLIQLKHYSHQQFFTQISEDKTVTFKKLQNFLNFQNSKNLISSYSSKTLIELYPELTNTGFTININLGSTQKELIVFLDIFNYYSYILTDSVLNKTICLEHEYYNNSLSQTYSYDQQTLPKKIFYRDFNLTGIPSKDNLYITSNSSLLFKQENKFPFLLVNQAEFKYNKSSCFPIDGGLGLGFNKFGLNFLDLLKKSGFIEKKIFALLLPLQNENAYLQLGGYKEEYINDTSKIKWVNVKINDLPYKNFNSTDNTQELKLLSDLETKLLKSENFNDYRYENNKSLLNWYMPAKSIGLRNNITIVGNEKIVFNSIMQNIVIPKKFFFENFKNIFDETNSCTIENDGYFYCSCSDFPNNFPYFQINLDGFTIPITPMDYTEIVINYSYDPSKSCKLLIKLNYVNDFWELGIFIMNNFYLIFDQEENKIGFYDRKLIGQFESGKALLLVMIVSLSTIFFFMILYCTFKNYINRPGNNMENNFNQVEENNQ